MKFITAFFLVVFMTIGSLLAQDYQKDSTSYVYYGGLPSKKFDEFYKKSGTSKSKGGSFVSSKNCVKIGVLEGIMGRPGIFYERALSSSFSVEVGFGVNFKSELLGSSVNGNFFRDSDLANAYRFDRGLGFQWSILPKFYTNKSAQKGFYLTAGIQQSIINFKYMDSNTGEQSDSYKQKSKEFGFGGGIGTQFFLSKIAIDINILCFYNKINQDLYSIYTGDAYNLKGNAPQITYSVKIGSFWGKGKSKE